VHALESLEIPPHLSYLEKIRDMFLLSCYAGLRYSDVIELDESCLQYSKGEGISLYYSMQHKTKVDVLMPVYLLFNRKPEQIVKKYLEKGDRKLFKGLSNQYVNRCLKQLAFLEIEFFVSTKEKHLRQYYSPRADKDGMWVYRKNEVKNEPEGFNYELDVDFNAMAV
jgi:hypothetical protein